MPKETAYENKAEQLAAKRPDSIESESELREWVSFAKTQALTTELLQFELDALADALEFKAKSVIEAFEDLVSLMQQSPQFAESEDVSQNLSNMVKSLQFQDIAKQKLENISGALQSIHGYANHKVTEVCNNYPINKSDIISDTENMDRIISDRTLAEMRKSMMKNLESLSKNDFEKLSVVSKEETHKEDSGTNVELF